MCKVLIQRCGVQVLLQQSVQLGGAHMNFSCQFVRIKKALYTCLH